MILFVISSYFYQTKTLACNCLSHQHHDGMGVARSEARSRFTLVTSRTAVLPIWAADGIKLRTTAIFTTLKKTACVSIWAIVGLIAVDRVSFYFDWLGFHHVWLRDWICGARFVAVIVSCWSTFASLRTAVLHIRTTSCSGKIAASILVRRHRAASLSIRTGATFWANNILYFCGIYFGVLRKSS